MDSLLHNAERRVAVKSADVRNSPLLRAIALSSLLLLVAGCSTGARIRNLLQYPQKLTDLAALDTLKIRPVSIVFTGTEIDSHYIFGTKTKLVGDESIRPVWEAGTNGCFSVENGAQVYMSDLRFRAGGEDSLFIQVDSGSLVLENCDFTGGDGIAIRVEAGASLTIKNLSFEDLGQGAIENRGGSVTVTECSFENTGEYAIRSTHKGDIRVTHTNIQGGRGNGLRLEDQHIIWLDSLTIDAMGKDGIAISNSPYLYANRLTLKQNNRHGVYLKNVDLAVLGDILGSANKLDALCIEDIDSLTILNSELMGNGRSGLSVTSAGFCRIAGSRIGHNNQGGLRISSVGQVSIFKTGFVSNMLMAVEVSESQTITMEELTLSSNQAGLQVGGFDSMMLKNCLFLDNRQKAAYLTTGQELKLKSNLFRDNQRALNCRNIHTTLLDSNIFHGNVQAATFETIEFLNSTANQWLENDAAAYFGDLAKLRMQQDLWRGNRKTALEAMNVQGVMIEQTHFVQNHFSAILNQAPLILKGCTIDSSLGAGLKILNGQLTAERSGFSHNLTAISMGDGCKAEILQSQFKDNGTAISTSASVNLKFSYNLVAGGREGIVMGNYALAHLRANRFNEIDGYCFVSTSPHMRDLNMRQNVILKTGGVMNISSTSGDIHCRSNTFAENLSGIHVTPEILKVVEHNVFYETPFLQPISDFSRSRIEWNCIYPDTAEDQLSESNIFADPMLTSNLYLREGSPCLGSRHGGMTIGALGGIPDVRPELDP